MNQPLTFSLYYHQNEFFKILKRIASIIDISCGPLYYHIKISSLRGPHLELTFLSEMDSLSYPLEVLSNQLAEFLIHEPSSNKGLKKTSHELFADFPNNTIHFGIHYWSPSPWSRNLSWKQHCQVSNLLLYIFQEYQEQTLSTLTEIGIQLLAIFCDASKKNIEASIEFTLNYIEREQKKYSEMDIKKVNDLNQDNYENNKATILAYLKQVFLGKKKPKSYWQLKWSDIIALSANDINRDIAIFPRLLFENLDYKEPIFSLGIFLRGLTDLKTTNYN